MIALGIPQHQRIFNIHQRSPDRLLGEFSMTNDRPAAPRIFAPLGHDLSDFVVSDCSDCDCACSPSAHVISRDKVSFNAPTLYSAKFKKIGIHKQFSACYNPDFSRPVLINTSALECLLHFNQPNSLQSVPHSWLETWEAQLVDSFLRDSIRFGLIVSDSSKLSACQNRGANLTAWIHITDICNLRCIYCYLPHKNRNMSLQTGYAAIDAALRSAHEHQYRNVTLKYAGGEPLIRFPLIVQLHQYACAIASRQNITIDGVLLSNGTLLSRRMARTIQEMKIRLVISLDGLGEFHDRQRYYVKRKGTSSEVVKAVGIALENGLTPHISITVTGQSINGLPDLLIWILERDLPFSLNFCRTSPLADLSLDLSLESEQIISGMKKAYEVIEKYLPRRTLVGSLLDKANLAVPHERTCGVGSNYMVFDYQGNIAKCQSQRDNPVTTVHADDPLALVRLDQHGIQNPTVTEKEGCRSCEWKYWCTGGCPLETYQATGSYYARSPLCRIYQALFPELIRLEGLRLLKYVHLEE